METGGCVNDCGQIGSAQGNWQSQDLSGQDVCCSSVWEGLHAQRETQRGTQGGTHGTLSPRAAEKVERKTVGRDRERGERERERWTEKERMCVSGGRMLTNHLTF